MATIVLRSVKGSPLTNAEIDANFTNLNNELATKLNSSSYTAADVRTKLITVDGSGSGIDADLLDGYHSSTGTSAGTVAVRDSNGDLPGNVLGSASTITSILGVNKGGTGSSDAATARTNLDVDQAGTALALSIALG